MRKFVLFIIYSLFVILLQTTILANFFTGVLHIDLVIFAIIALALSEDQKGVVPIIIFIGLLVDIFSVGPFGLSVFSYLIVYGFLRMIISKIMIDVLLAMFVWIGVASIIEMLVSSLLFYIWADHLVYKEVFIKRLFLQALFNSFLGMMFVPLLRKYERFSLDSLFRSKKIIVK